MDKGLGEIVGDTFSNLLPLLGLLFGIFAVLIVCALVLRHRVAAATGRRPVRQAAARAGMVAGDVVSVLGKTFQLTGMLAARIPQGEADWCLLAEGESTARLLLLKDRSSAQYFPGQGPSPAADPAPAELKRDDGIYTRSGQSIPLSPDLTLTLYAGPAEHYVALEKRGDGATLWRGKAIPPEGVRVIEER